MGERRAWLLPPWPLPRQQLDAVRPADDDDRPPDGVGRVHGVRTDRHQAAGGVGGVLVAHLPVHYHEHLARGVEVAGEGLRRGALGDVVHHHPRAPVARRVDGVESHARIEHLRPTQRAQGGVEVARAGVQERAEPEDDHRVRRFSDVELRALDLDSDVAADFEFAQLALGEEVHQPVDDQEPGRPRLDRAEDAGLRFAHEAGEDGAGTQTLQHLPEVDGRPDVPVNDRFGQTQNAGGIRHISSHAMPGLAEAAYRITVRPSTQY